MKNLFERELVGSKICTSNVKLPNFKPFLHTLTIKGETNFSHRRENFNDFKIFMATATDEQSLIISSIFLKIGVISEKPNFHTDYITSVVWSHDNKFIFTSSEDETVSMFDVESDKILKSIRTEYHGTEIKTNPNSSIIDIVTGNELILWDTRLDGIKKIRFQGGKNSIQDVERIGDENIILVSETSGNLNWIDLRTEKKLMTLKCNESIKNMEYKNGMLLMNTFTECNCLKNVDFFIGRDFKDSLTNFKNSKMTYYSTFSNDGDYVIGSGEDNEVILWNVDKASISQTIRIPNEFIDGNEFLSDSLFISRPYYLPNDMIAVSYSIGTIIYSLHDYGPSIPLTSEDELIDESIEPWERIESSEDETYGLCSFEKGYIDQIVFICLTCYQQNNVIAGICAQCSEFCHADHDIYNIGKKSKFKCDCCTKFKCELNDSLNQQNEENKYNHNFKNEWCYCDQHEERPMYQCENCEDWFHGKCIGTNEVNPSLK
jgi:hypothetical protein